MAEAAEGMAEISSSPPLPAASPATCSTCTDLAADCSGGSALFWQDLAGEVHCAACVKVPSRRMVKELWTVVWVAAEQRAGWAPWRPVHFRLFDHFEVGEAARQAVEGSASGTENF